MCVLYLSLRYHVNYFPAFLYIALLFLPWPLNHTSFRASFKCTFLLKNIPNLLLLCFIIKDDGILCYRHCDGCFARISVCNV